jgi:adenylate kinase family enzyme
LVTYYRRLGFLYDVDARKSVEEVQADILHALAGIIRGAR